MRSFIIIGTSFFGPSCHQPAPLPTRNVNLEDSLCRASNKNLLEQVRGQPEPSTHCTAHYVFKHPHVLLHCSLHCALVENNAFSGHIETVWDVRRLGASFFNSEHRHRQEAVAKGIDGTARIQ